MKKDRHLCAGNKLVRTEPVVERRVAAACHTCCAQLVDVVLEKRAVVVGEQVGPSARVVAERPDEESRHLRPRHRTVGAETIIVGWIAALRNAGAADPVDVGLEYRTIIVDKDIVL